MLIQSKSVFDPIPNHFQDSKVYLKRQILSKRTIIPNFNQNNFSQKTSILSNYDNMKRKLQEYIKKQKKRIKTHQFDKQYNYSSKKTIMNFRNKHINRSKHSILTIPSEEFKLSLTENVIENKKQSFKEYSKSKKKLSNRNDSNPRYQEQNITNNIGRHRYHFSTKSHQLIIKTQIQPNSSTSLHLKQKKALIKGKSSISTTNIQTSNTKKKAKALICQKFKPLKLYDFKNKKNQFIKISQSFRAKNPTKMKFINIDFYEKMDDVSPWIERHQQSAYSAFQI